MEKRRDEDSGAPAALRPKRPFVRMSGPKPTWTDDEKRSLSAQAKALAAKLGRALRPADLKRIKIPRRSFFAVKAQAARLGLYPRTRRIQRWNAREEQMLVLLAGKRKLGARSIKGRGFFSASSDHAPFWADRSVDSIAQKKRRHGLVDPKRSQRAKYAKRLTSAERKKLRSALRRNPQRKSNDEFAQEYGVSSSTIRRYRKEWSIRQSWHEAMQLPSSREKRKVLVEETRLRNRARWKRQKSELAERLEKHKQSLLARAAKRGRELEWRVCARCGREWPKTDRFFAWAPKRQGGTIIARYLRRRCRICPRKSS